MKGRITMEKMQKKQGVFVVVLGIYALCFSFRIWEYFILRTDQTVLGEAVVHKLLGIAILFIVAKMLHLTLKEIGFSKERSLHNVLKGLAFGVGTFIIAYVAEIIILMVQGKFDSLQIYVSAYAVDKNVGYQTAFVFFIICILGNIINVIMEDGVFRGLFIRILEERYSFTISAVLSSVLFAFWHGIGPIRNYYDGISSMGGMIANVIMLVVTSGLVGFKFALLTKMTGSAYMAMGDHFVNNMIVNLLHVVSHTGADELMIVRLSIAQSISCIIVLLYYWKEKLKYRNKCAKYTAALK